MRCLLVIPPWSFSHTHPGYVTPVTGATMPGGVTYLASSLMRDNHQVEILDGHFVSQDAIIRRLRNGKHELLGISSVCALWNSSLELINRVEKEVDHKVFIVAGGQGPSGMGIKCFDNAPGLNAIIKGEGEEAIRELAMNIRSSGKLDKIPGVIFKEGNEIITGPPPKLIEDLDRLAFPAIELLRFNEYIPAAAHYRRRPLATVTSSRGCPNSCMYCFKISGNTIRMRSPENVVKEILHDHDKFGAKEIIFWDEHFTYDRERVLEICDRLRSAGNPVIWWCAGRVDSVDEVLLHAMKKAGCYQILFGIESGSDRILKFIGKKTNRDLIHRAVTLAKKCRLKVYGTFILGLPTETYEEALETIKFAIKLNPDIVEFFPATPFFGTELARRIHEFGTVSEDIDQLGMHLFSFVPYTLNKEQLIQLRNKSYKKFYLRPYYITKQMLSIRSWTELKDIYYGAKALLVLMNANKLPKNQKC